MSGTSAFFWHSCSAESDTNDPVSTSSHIKVCDFETLIRGQDKKLSTKEPRLANKFSLLSFFNESIGTWVFAHLDTSEVSVLSRADFLSPCCCTQKQGREKTAPNQNKCLMTGVRTLIRCKFFQWPERLFFAFNLFSLETTIEPCFEFLPRLVFLCLAIFLWTDLQSFCREPEWTRLDKAEGKHSWICGRMMGTLEKQTKFYAQRPKLQMLPKVRVKIFWWDGFTVCTKTKSIVWTRR